MSQSGFERKILRDNRSGSSEILNSTLDYNLRYIKEINPDAVSLGHLIKFNMSVLAKFSAMAIVANRLARVNQIISETISNNKSKAHLLKQIERLIKEMSEIDKKVIKNCASLFMKSKGKIAIATYSNSGLVKKVINHYRKKISKIYLSEARPANEGRGMAQYIADAGIDVVLSIDALLPTLLSNVELLLLGADSVGRDRFINKIGSELLLREAGRKKIKTAVLFESLKIKKISKSGNIKSDYNYREVWPKGIQNSIRIINQYFEIIDNRMVDRFISDLGADTALSLKKRITA